MVNERYELIKKAVWEKYNYRCFYCKTNIRSSLTVHHIISRKLGGTDDLDNLVLTCDKCKKYILPLAPKNSKEPFSELSNDVVNNIETYCEAKARKEKMVPLQTFISFETYKRLIEIKNKTSATILMECFEGSLSNTGKAYKVEFKCEKCGKTVYELMSKTSLGNRINQNFSYICLDCMPKPEYTPRDLEKELQERTSNFIAVYCNPDVSWKKDAIKPSEAYNQLVDKYEQTDEFKVAAYLRKLPYKQFLKTPYWAAVAAKKKIKAHYRCELCNKEGMLNVHHRTYEHHGYEITNLSDLTVLCSDCHSKFHDIIQED